MKNLFFIATLIFWLTIATFWITSVWLPVSDDTDDHRQMTVYALSDVVKHNQQSDCWMAIHGQVYDLTIYLPKHPTASHVILPFCGTEASHAYDTKNRGRAHSETAHALLAQYRIGTLNQ